MESNYPTYNSGDSSPRSRETDFENPSLSWEEPPNSSTTLPPNHKVKFMVSYNGKIQPRSHDKVLSYLGGDTKILSVDRAVKFSSFYSKLASLITSDSATADADTVAVAVAATLSAAFTCKYQLPGEDLDALISVTNDDDLLHLMHEYDRLFKGTNKPVRLRLFLFSPDQSSRSGFSSVSSEPGRIGPDPEPDRDAPVHNNVDFLFGLDKVSVQVPGPVQSVESVSEPMLLQELNRLKISALEFQQQSAINSPEKFENLADLNQKPQSPVNIPVNYPPPVQTPAGLWRPIEHQIQNHPPQQQVYMMQAPPHGGVYHAPPVAQPNQGYYQMQRMPSDQPYMMQPVHSTPPPPQVAQVAYDSATGRQVYYAAAAQGGVMAAPFPGMAAKAVMVAGDGKVVHLIRPSTGV